MKKLIISLLALMLVCATGALADFSGSVNISLDAPADGAWDNSTVMDFYFVVVGNGSEENYSCNLYHNIDQAFGVDNIQVNSSVLGGNSTYFRKTGISENSTGWLWNIGCSSTKNSTVVQNVTANYTLKVDATAPVLSASSPANRAWDTDGKLNLSVNITEANQDSCILNNNLNTTEHVNTTGEFNYSVVTQAYSNHEFLIFDFGNISNDQTVWIDDSYGNYSWNVSCNDSAGNVLNTDAITFYVDSLAPTGINVTAPTNLSTSTDYTPVIHWENTTELNFSHYQIFVDNDSDFSSPEYEENITDMSQNWTTASTGLSGDVTYYFNVTAFDLAGNSASDRNALVYSTDSTCHTLYTGWNICSIIRTNDTDASDICDEVGSTCTYVAKYNGSHVFQTFTRGAATNADLLFNANTTPDENAVVFIYVSSETTYENRTWGVSASTFNFTLRNAGTGWNIVPILNRSGIKFWEIDYSLNANWSIGGSTNNQTDPMEKGYTTTSNNISRFLSYFNESAASGSQYVPYRSNWSWYNTTFIDYGDAVWMHYNTTTDTTHTWDTYNRSGEED